MDFIQSSVAAQQMHYVVILHVMENPFQSKIIHTNALVDGKVKKFGIPFWALENNKNGRL